MVRRHSAETVGCAFTKQYYQVLYHQPEDTHKFYKDSSVAGWEGKDGIVHSVTTMKGIHDMIMSSDYKDSDVEVKGVYAQDSLHESILLVVTGTLTGKDDVIRTFSHTFLLARQERGFFVLNDILRFLDIPPSTPEAANGSTINASESPSSSNSGFLELVEDSEKTCTKAEAEVTNSEPKLNQSPEENQEMTSESLKPPPPAVVSPTKDTTPKTTYLEKLSKENKSPLTHLVQIVRVSASDGSLIETKTQVPTVNEPIKKTNLQPNSVVSKPSSPPSDETAENIYQSMGIYIGGLPPNTTKNELTEAVKIFGRIRKNDGVQVIDNRNEDGFTYAFVHFETEEAAHRAIEAHNITIRGKEAYITYKKSNARGSNGYGRAPTGRDWPRRYPSSGRVGSYNNGYGDGGEDGGFYEYEYHYHNRSSEGHDRDRYQWNGGGGGRRGIRGGY
ncbi:unnamed protein product [Cuscuta campestris]|uniref:RRM domain-containing protein n=1 Tax=Cuscuta campestris TaxID=132261 RepID=A0A484MAP5_9ASTE|nr:unnamed protein product [Cuscuta campestris]